MYFQKKPLSSGLLSFPEVTDFLSRQLNRTVHAPVFYDIETTGLSHTSAAVYLAGAVFYENGTWMYAQWMSGSAEDEPLILEAFAGFLCRHADCTVQYNGSTFDQPFLSARYRHYQIPDPLHTLPALDLYRALCPLKTLLKLDSMKQPCLEAFLSCPKRLYPDGKEGIRLYRKFCTSPESSAQELLLGHNREDLQGLMMILPLLAYLDLYTGDYEVSGCSFADEKVLFELKLSHTVPVLFSNGNVHFYITGNDHSIRLSAEAPDGNLRLYYKDYKNYDYIPSEDRAIPKALSACLEKHLRVPATADTCYTRVFCSPTFLETSAMQKQYLEHSLPYYLKTLEEIGDLS